MLVNLVLRDIKIAENTLSEESQNKRWLESKACYYHK